MKKRRARGTCVVCGEINLPDYFTIDEELIAVPVAIASTLKELEELYFGFDGKTYLECTGNKIKDSFKKSFITPSHESPDDVGIEEALRHALHPVECWVEEI